MSVSVCVCLSVIISPELHVRSLPNFFVHVVYGRGSVFLWWHGDKLHISGFVDDVISAHKLIGCSHGSTSTSAFNLMPSSFSCFPAPCARLSRHTQALKALFYANFY